MSLDDVTGAGARHMAFGIRDGNGVIFVSHLGEVYPAGFLPYPLARQRQGASRCDEIYREVRARSTRFRTPTTIEAVAADASSSTHVAVRGRGPTP